MINIREKLYKNKNFIRTAVAVVIAGAVYCLIAFTPLRTTIPGYPDSRTRQQAIRNAILIDSLENIITRWELYAENLDRVLVGEQTLSLDSIISGNKTKYLQRISDEQAKEAEEKMRELVREEEKFVVTEGQNSSGKMEGFHFFTPLKGVVTATYDPILHPGIDINAPENTVVCATLDGTVIFTGWSDEDGYVMQIQHEDNLVSSYRHNIKLLRESGNKVKAGDPIALAGKYLHFELWHNGESINPSEHINQK